MSLSIGTVTVNPDGTYGGAGLAFDMASSWMAVLDAASVAGGVPLEGPRRITVMQFWADVWLGQASAIINHFTANAVTSTPNVAAGGVTRTGTIA